jgi:uncharacterized protein (TIGR03435 family)
MRAALLLVTIAVSASAQEFEVATVKLSPPPEGDLININLGTAVNGRVTLTNAALSDCLKFAYGIVSDAQLVAPDWARSVRYDIVGQAPAPTPRDELLVMLQKLLAERLRVALHKEQRELAHLALVQERGGSKLRPSAVDAATAAAAPPGSPQLPGRITSPRMPMSVLALLLSRFERQTVIDGTGLEGFYEVKLDWTPERNFTAPAGKAPTLSEGPSLFAAVREQLGLRLESRKGPVEVLVMDSADRTPADN